MGPAYIDAFAGNPAFRAALNVAGAVARGNGIEVSEDDMAVIGAAFLSAFAAEGGLKMRSRYAIKAASGPMLSGLMAEDDPPPPARSPCPAVPARDGAAR